MTGHQHQPSAASRLPNIGLVTSIRGSVVTMDIVADADLPNARVTIGSFVGVRAGDAYLVGVVTTLSADAVHDSARSIRARANLDLLGQILCDARGEKSFRRGVACYPAIGDPVELLSSENFRLIYHVSAANTVEIGSLYQDASTPACVKVNDLLSKHFAVLGTTGVGKSSGVAVIVDTILQSGKDIRVFLLDVHNEYASCFGARASVISPHTLKLPFWMFNLEEIADVIYGGRPPVDEEIEILTEVIPLAKNKYAQYGDGSDRQLVKRAIAKGSGYTVDTPVPYLLQDLISLIDERMGRLDNRASRMHYHRLITRIETIRNDPRYRFMFDNANVGGDVMGELLAHFFRLEPDGKPITIMQLAGLPPEVMDAVVCVLCRLAFDFGVWSDGAIPLLFVCEEAHRYASADRMVGFAPTRRALARIAREGRKHGVYLGLVTQRPAELDPTIISQCSTIFAMRMSNDRDQAILSAAISDSANLLTFVPLLGTGEVIAFGEGVPLPARMKFRALSSQAVPRSQTLEQTTGADGSKSNAALIGAAVDRWRGATMNKVAVSTEQPGQARPKQEGSTEVSKAALDHAHGRLVRRHMAPAAQDEAAPETDTRAAGALWRQ